MAILSKLYKRHSMLSENKVRGCTSTILTSHFLGQRYWNLYCHDYGNDTHGRMICSGYKWKATLQATKN